MSLGPLSGVSISRLNGVGALWDCVPRVCGSGGGCAGGSVPLGAVPALFWCGEVSFWGKHIIIYAAYQVKVCSSRTYSSSVGTDIGSGAGSFSLAILLRGSNSKIISRLYK